MLPPQPPTKSSKVKSMGQLLLLVLICVSTAFAQRLDPVAWTLEPASSETAPGGAIRARVTAKLDAGWHIYSLTTPQGGPTPTTIKLAPDSTLTGLKLYQLAPVTKFDPTFKVNTEIFEKEVTFLADATVPENASAGSAEQALLVRYQACTEKECLPRKITLSLPYKVNSKGAAAALSVPSGYTEARGQSPASASAGAGAAPSGDSDQQSLGAFLLVAFGFGLGAIFTPCVFPMIPITLSFFLKRPGATRADSIKQALLFCLGIVVLFTVIGLSIAALIGPFGVVQLGSNPWVNGFIALVFLVFGLSLLGAYEFTLPSALLTKMDQASQRGGIAGTLLMGLTFALTSFACVGPFVGPLLAGSVQRGGIQPALGMITFASGLSTPFFVLALFPSFLERMPRSGGWLARVKIVLGFVVLAAMLKYISSIDQVLQWNILTRERFLAAWFVLFALAGLYLLGLLRMEGIKGDETVGVGRVLAGAAFLIFAISLVPGMFGGKLGELDSFVPLATETASFGGRSSRTELSWLKNDWDTAAAQARAENKQILIAFTGYACTNCHWMKANMFTRPEIAALMRKYVLIELYTDGTDAVSERNQQLQETKFRTVSIPYYAIVDADQRVIASSAGLTRDVPEFMSFLQNGAATQTASSGY